MRNLLVLLVSAGSITLSGCAYGGMGGPLGGADVLGSVLGSVIGQGSGYGYGQGFEEAAVNACGNYASRYGRVSITNVDRRSGSSIRVYGVVDNGGYERRNFGCTFRDDGRISDFDL